MIVLSLVYFVSFMLESFLFCHPVDYNWNKSIDGTCKDPSLEYLLAAITNLLINIIIIFLLLPLLWKLQIQLTKKNIITGIFSLGLV